MESVQQHPLKETYSNLSHVCLLLDEFEEAERHAISALKLDPAFMKAWYRKGMALLKREKAQDAITCFKKVLEKSPEDKMIQKLLSEAQALWEK